VVVTYLSGDPRYPVVLGGIWNGKEKPPETLGGSSIDRWTITGKAGTRIAIVEAASGSPTISFTTPGGLTGTMTDAGGGSIEFSNKPGTSIKLDSSGITIATMGTVQINANLFSVSASTVEVASNASTFASLVQCQALMTPSVVSATYSTGAGNIL
jgi:uncharacterized protein involved in type VI secretion and phage assembly